MRTRSSGGDDHTRRLVVSELWTATPDALRGLLGLLGSEATQFAEVDFEMACLPPTPDLLWVLPEFPLRSSHPETWLLRVLDPSGALAARGWPEVAQATPYGSRPPQPA